MIGGPESASAVAGSAAIIPVLLYHTVTDNPPAGFESFTATPAQFREHIAAIRDCGRTPVTITELAEVLRGEHRPSAGLVAVTFDDGYSDTARAVDALAENEITSTVFVTSGQVGTPWGVSAGEIGQIAACRAEIGAHTVTHPYLDELDHDAITTEVQESRDALEQILGAPVTSFAYPHGAYDQRVRAAVMAARMSAGAAVKNALSHRDDDPFAIARWTIRSGTSVADVERVLSGRGLPMAWRDERLRTRAFRYARRSRRHLSPSFSKPEASNVA